MTLVVWDGRFIAADSQVTVPGDMRMKPYKKIIIRDRLVFACLGVRNLIEPMIEWYLDDETGPEDMPKVINDEDHTTMVVWSDGTCEIFATDMPYPDAIREPTAWGCGRDFAIGAMDAGCDAKRACEIAVARHALLGGPVQVIDLLQLQECAA
jgi:ATP-dependent protease HslVU (ClpYQ) peptidase subunit